MTNGESQTVPSSQAPALGPQAQAFIERKLRTAWRKERRFHHARGLCFLLVWAVLLIVLDLLVDWLFLATYRVPGWGRLILLGINAITLVWVAHHYWLRYLRRYDPVRVSLQVERKHPELKSLLVSYVQLSDALVAQTQASPVLVRAVRREAAVATRPMDFREIVNFQTLGRLFVFSACVLGLFGGISVYKSDFFRTLIQRMLNPSSSLEYPTRTVIVRVTGDVSVQQGTPVSITAVCTGEIPPRGRLFIKVDEGSWETLSLLPASFAELGSATTAPATAPAPDRGKAFTYRFSEVRQSFDYYVRLGDDESRRYRVEVIPAPKVIAKQIILEHPPHAGGQKRTQDSYYIEVPEGTKVTWRLTLDSPVGSAGILRNGVDVFGMQIQPGGHQVECSLAAWQTFEYQFRWAVAGHPFLYTSAMPYVVNVVPDADPEADILQPLGDEKATVRKKLTVTFRAKDDNGLSEAFLVYRVGEGPEQRWRIGLLSGRDATQTFSKKLAELVEGLKVDDVVTYWIEVTDNYPGRPGAEATPGGSGPARLPAGAGALPAGPATTRPTLWAAKPGPNVGRSQKRRVYIISVVDYLRGILEERMRWVTEVEELRGEEKSASETVGEMKKTPAPPATQPSGTR